MENKENIDVAPDETSVANAANLDALVAPEGGYDAETDGESFMKSEDQLLDNSNDENLAPNIDQEIKPPNDGLVRVQYHQSYHHYYLDRL